MASLVELGNLRLHSEGLSVPLLDNDCPDAGPAGCMIYHDDRAGRRQMLGNPPRRCRSMRP
jgi:hypothetical protein